MVPHGIVVADHGARLHAARRKAVVAEFEPGDVGGTGEGGFGRFFVSHVPVEGQIGAVILVENGGIRIERARRIGVRRQHIVIDRHHLGGIARRELVLGHDQRHRIADMASAISGQNWAHDAAHRLSGALRQVPQARGFAKTLFGPVRRRENGKDTGHRLRLVCHKAADDGMCVRAAHECRVRHIGQLDVVHIGSAAAQKPLVLPPHYRLADVHVRVLGLPRAGLKMAFPCGW